MARSSTTRPEEQALDDALRSLFSAVQTRVLPDSLRFVIDQLDEAERAAAKKAA
ncbi:hypothetical protein LJR219_001515 [Phenylobacterium sp. LjRoot219]|uniref:hypothetical protein n=1 Tax=Phenylobacterium sp. LjRoot219 TaxID=3342283 RepID=UPI003ED10582